MLIFLFLFICHLFRFDFLSIFLECAGVNAIMSILRTARTDTFAMSGYLLSEIMFDLGTILIFLAVDRVSKSIVPINFINIVLHNLNTFRLFFRFEMHKH